MKLKNDFLITFFFLSIVVIFYLFFYPPFYSIMDECDYLTTAYTLKKWTFFLDKVGIPPSTATVIGKRHMFSKYPPGNPLLLFIFTFLHWKIGFIMNFLFFILSFIVFCLLLKEYNISPIFSLLLLLHPSVILYSRTLMSDIPSMFFILYGIYLILKEKKFLSGLVLGFSLLLRFSNAVIISGVLLYLFFNDRKNLHRFLPGIFIFILIQSFYNIFVMEGLFAPFLLPTGAGGLSIIYIKDIGLYYFISLNILYPLMLLVFILNLKNREYFLYTFPALITLFFFSFYYYIDKGNSFIETLVKGQRFMIPIIPLLLLIYSNSLNKLRYSKSMILLASFFLLIFDGGINYKMYSFQKEKGILKDIIYENTKDADIIICNGEVCKLFNPFFGSKRWINYVFDGKLSIKKEDFKKFNNIYLCFIESSKEKNAKEIFFDTLLTMFNTEKIIEIQKPSYLILVKVIKDW